MITLEPLGLSANQWQFLCDVGVQRYVDASGGKLLLESTRRQFATARDILARLNGSQGEKERRGILLADDAGLGKTTVAALVAWVVASAGDKRGVRILAPNDVMARRWREELFSHVEPLNACAPGLDVNKTRVKDGTAKRLSAGSIQVVKHSYASKDFKLACDLLIVDEAHRAKGENTAFSNALKRQKNSARRVLILTATPFSIHLDELERMLALIGGEVARGPVRSFSRALTNLYRGDATRPYEVVAAKLAGKARAAVDALRPFVIRHGIDDLTKEQAAFGDRADWQLNVPEARIEELELMLRMERALRVAKDNGSQSTKATNDARFHVGWRHLDAVRETLAGEARQLADPAKVVVENQLKSIRRLRKTVGVHSKMAAVGEAVKSIIKQGHKVLLFCHHHATAQELTIHLQSVAPKLTPPRSPAVVVWRAAWNQVLAPPGDDHRETQLRQTFLAWLCADLIRAQTWSWLSGAPATTAKLAKALRDTNARRSAGGETVAEAGRRLYAALLQSRSSSAVLEAAAERPELLPGANGGSRVLGVCEPTEDRTETRLFIHNAQPDTVISIFNSPFGPDVLVVTDKLSEGIDLHRYCRHLIHYELDPSPIRTVQRNGRVRRVNSWAAVSGQPVQYAYPAFRGTRDLRLVQIMKKRIDSFSLLLGGVQDFDVDDVVGSEEEWRNSVIATAKKSLRQSGGQLRAREPGRG
jgi:superfamily II DNA or RNA helicase